MASSSAFKSKRKAAGPSDSDVAQAERKIAQGLGQPILFRMVAEARMKVGRFAEAGALLNQALAIDRNDPDCLCALGELLVNEARADEAVGVFGQALRAHPMHAAGWLGLGRALEAIEQDGQAIQAYQRAASLLPDDPAPLAGMAELHLRAGRTEEALVAAAQALTIDKSNAVANLVCARAALRAKQPEEARQRIEALLVRQKLTLFEQLTALKTLGDAFDRLDKIPEAFNAYDRLNQTTVKFNNVRFGPGGSVENHLAFIERLGRGYAAAAAGRWADAPAEAAPSPVAKHVFVMGYPRSGNTLIGAVLGSLLNAKVLEERPTLFDADLAFLRDPGDLARLATLGDEEAERLRGQYWERVRKEAGDLVGALLVDMSPLNSTKLPLIRKLFPTASIVLCSRDPRDVVFSCWRQSFVMNASTYQMTDLQSAARHFDATLKLTEACLPMIGGDVHQVSYETFIADFEQGARRLSQAVEVEWSDAVLNFSEAAKGRQLRTASASQIRGGLFDGRAQWVRYAAYLQPIMPILQPWIDRRTAP